MKPKSTLCDYSETCAEFEKSKMLSMRSANREFQGYTPVVHLQRAQINRWSVLSFQNRELLSARHALVPPFLSGAHCPCDDNHCFYHYHLLLFYIFINYMFVDKKGMVRCSCYSSAANREITRALRCPLSTM